MRIDIITTLPKLVESPFSDSILKRAQTKGLVEINVIDLRQYSTSRHKSTDDYAFGGGAGMVMMIEPIDNCITDLKSVREYDEVIYMSPDGEPFAQPLANSLSLKKNLIILCGHYKGVDERVREHLITREISIGDYVLSGGELDSFQDGIIAPPVYTRPAEYKGWRVPDILLSGHEAKIEEWRHQKALERTQERRPELLKNS
jgi:tRNA (guanine37-N1)-methyltransferase